MNITLSEEDLSVIDNSTIKFCLIVFSKVVLAFRIYLVGAFHKT